MTYIQVSANQISDSFFETEYSKVGKVRLKRYFAYFKHIEGIPVIEETADNTYRLITLHENYEFFKTYYRDYTFTAHLKSFSSDTERYLELLKHLFDGNATSKFNDKHTIIQFLLISLSDNEISKRVNIPISEIRKHIFKDIHIKCTYNEQASKVLGLPWKQ